MFWNSVVSGGRRRGGQEHRSWHRHPFTVVPHYLSSSLPLPRVTSVSHFLFTPLLLFLATSSLRYISSSLTLCLVPHYLFTFVPRYLLTSLPRYFVTLSALCILTFCHVYVSTPLRKALLRCLSRQLHIRRDTVLHRDLVTS